MPKSIVVDSRVRDLRDKWLNRDPVHRHARMPPTGRLNPVRGVDRETMLAAERIATDRLGLGLLQMMENAGRELADLTRHALVGSVYGRSVVVLAGTGNNAGGGLVAARRLAGWGPMSASPSPVRSCACGPERRAQNEPLLAAGVRTAVAGVDRSYPELATEITAADAVIDALIGYTLRGAPDDRDQPLIGIAGLGPGPVISLDLPSGSTRVPVSGRVAADMTLALVLPKRGLQVGEGRRFAAIPYLADIGIPASVFGELGVPGHAGLRLGPDPAARHRTSTEVKPILVVDPSTPPAPR